MEREGVVAEYSIDVSYTRDENFKRWKYTSYNFTLAILTTPILVKAEEADRNGPTHMSLFDLYLDEVDETWTTHIAEFNYMIISAGHWVYRPAMFYKNHRLVDCRFCQIDNVNDLPKYYASRRVFQTAFRARKFQGYSICQDFCTTSF
ncbi:hypothetical protein Vadar_023332 [Vaccinium darrowii]|uniref:Uncharacterized protein n=1 Tax=Vaccinium darrowii TaxID=229202 RepID=A0ACB7Y9Q4_9ERIC|nr:hypothetical protein Vadar_023332 [Vaccinium darrowii]